MRADEHRHAADEAWEAMALGWEHTSPVSLRPSSSGTTGRVISTDLTPTMVEIARRRGIP